MVFLFLFSIYFENFPHYFTYIKSNLNIQKKIPYQIILKNFDYLINEKILINITHLFQKKSIHAYLIIKNILNHFYYYNYLQI